MSEVAPIPPAAEPLAAPEHPSRPKRVRKKRVDGPAACVLCKAGFPTRGTRDEHTKKCRRMREAAAAANPPSTPPSADPIGTGSGAGAVPPITSMPSSPQMSASSSMVQIPHPLPAAGPADSNMPHHQQSRDVPPSAASAPPAPSHLPSDPPRTWSADRMMQGGQFVLGQSVAIPCEEGDEEDQLARHPYLSSLGLVVNTYIESPICEFCEVTFQRDALSTHLSGKAHQSSHIRVDYKKYREVMEQLGVGEMLPYPPEGLSFRIQGLKVMLGIRCGACPKPFGSVKTMKAHHRAVHKGVTMPKSWSTCWMQQFNRGNASRLFEIELPNLPVQSSIRDDEAIIAEFTAQPETDLMQTPPEEDALVSPWLLDTGWHLHVAPFDVAELRSLAAFPKPDEFHHLHKAVHSYFEAATALILCTDRLILQRLNTEDPAKTGIINEPFHKTQLTDSLTDYTRDGCSILAFILRPKVDYQMPLPEEVVETFDDLQLMIPDAGHDSMPFRDRIHESFLSLWMRQWRVSDTNAIPCPTQRWLALRSVKPDGSIEEAKGNTRPFARCTRLMRLCFLFEMHRLARTKYDGDMERACEELQRWFVEKVNTPFNTVRTLQHFASALAGRTPKELKVIWTDRINWQSMRYKGDPIHMNQIRQVFANLEQAVVTQWEEKVLCGMKLYVPMGEIADDLSNHDVDYSFVSDRRNAQFQDRDHMIRAILSHPAQRDRFCKPSSDGKSTVFNKPALRDWLYQYSIFHSQMLARADMLSASTTRGMELFLMQFVNTKFRNARNLCMIDKYLALMVRYTKNNNRDRCDQQVPHALDGVTSDLLLQDLAIARPFAQQIIRHCFPGDSQLSDLYGHRLFVNYLKPFDDKSLTQEINRHMVPVLGFELGIRGFRDVSPAFQRKLCTCLEDLMDGGEDQRVIAAQMTHSYRTHTDIYGTSTDALAGPAEDTLLLFMDASTDWHVEGRTVPGGLQLPYYMARTTSFNDLVKSGRIKPGQLKAALSGHSEERDDNIVRKVVDALSGQMANVEGALSTAIVEKLIPAAVEALILYNSRSRGFTGTFLYGPPRAPPSIATALQAIADAYSVDGVAVASTVPPVTST